MLDAALYLFSGLVLIKGDLKEDVNNYPNIAQLFPEIQPANSSMDFGQPESRRLAPFEPEFDITKIDVPELTKKLNDIRLQLEKKDPDFSKTRRQLPTKTCCFFFGWSWASGHYTKLKALDTMLTMLYMARHKIRELENNKMFNAKDTSYRISYLYIRIRSLWKIMMDLFETLTRNIRSRDNWWIYYDFRFVTLHQKAIKIHTEFTYLWWVLVRLHEKWMQRQHIYMTRPPTPRLYVSTKPRPSRS